MSKMYESLMEGLMEDLQDIQTYGEPQGRKTVIEYMPVKAYTAAEVKSIRKDLGVSQPAFAKCLGVSRKTVEKWESGDISRPDLHPMDTLLGAEVEFGVFVSSSLILF